MLSSATFWGTAKRPGWHIWEISDPELFGKGKPNPHYSVEPLKRYASICKYVIVYNFLLYITGVYGQKYKRL